jgi:secondary thiamine-phosphate synthase enzyme
MRMLFENHSFTTSRCMELVDVTNDLTELVGRSGVKNGMAVVYSPHTTCAVIINERETGFIHDFEELVQSLVPETRAYRHDDMTLRTENLEDDSHDVPNGHAHVKQGLIGSASQTIPVVDGQLQLGRWQRVFFVELDRSRDRRVLMQVLGD